MPDIQSRLAQPLAINASATQAGVMWNGGLGTCSMTATWGGGTVTLQTQTISGTWVAVGSNTTMTADGIAGFLLPKGALIRASIATATAVYVYVAPLEG